MADGGAEGLAILEFGLCRPAGTAVAGLPAFARRRDANGSAVAGRRSSGRRGPLAGRIGAEASPDDVFVVVVIDDMPACEDFAPGEKRDWAEPGRVGGPLEAAAAAASRLRAAMVSFNDCRPGAAAAAVTLREKRGLLVAAGPIDCWSFVATGFARCFSSDLFVFASRDDMILSHSLGQSS